MWNLISHFIITRMIIAYNLKFVNTFTIFFWKIIFWKLFVWNFCFYLGFQYKQKWLYRLLWICSQKLSLLRFRFQIMKFLFVDTNKFSLLFQRYFHLKRRILRFQKCLTLFWLCLLLQENKYLLLLERGEGWYKLFLLKIIGIKEILLP